jgi:hypothetical protein
VSADGAVANRYQMRSSASEKLVRRHTAQTTLNAHSGGTPSGGWRGRERFAALVARDGVDAARMHDFAGHFSG